MMVDRLDYAPQRDREHEQRTVMVGIPAPHEGVQRALSASFGQVPTLPEEFVRLLGILR